MDEYKQSEFVVGNQLPIHFIMKRKFYPFKCTFLMVNIFLKM